MKVDMKLIVKEEVANCVYDFGANKKSTLSEDARVMDHVSIQGCKVKLVSCKYFSMNTITGVDWIARFSEKVENKGKVTGKVNQSFFRARTTPIFVKINTGEMEVVEIWSTHVI